MESIYLVITTFPTREEAINMASRIIENKLGACVQIQEPCTSIYEWKGVLETTTEFPVHIKTVEAKKEALKTFIKVSHSYKVPEIVAIKLDETSETYAQWIATQTCGASS
jgi:periplasmic divalent cation tolerance protein